MDHRQFDHLARDLGQVATRRNAFRAILAAVVGAIIGWLPGARPAAAAPDCCPSTYPSLCNLKCVNLKNDNKNCGRCGKTCPAGTNVCKKPVCTSGNCGFANKPNGTACTGTNPCKTYTTCSNGVCSSSNKANGTSCGTNKICQSGVCVNQCTNGVKDGNETDIDCGGSCPACDWGYSCVAHTDCISRRCVTGLCVTCIRDSECTDHGYDYCDTSGLNGVCRMNS